MAERATLEDTPPELLADILEHGIMLAGGALLKGLDRRGVPRLAARRKDHAPHVLANTWPEDMGIAR